MQWANKVNHKTSKKAAGFTLLELSIVLILVAILAAVFLFKIELLQDTRYNKLSVKLTAQALQSAVNITHSLWLVKDLEKELENQTSLSNVESSLLTNYGKGNVQMSSKGWPIDAVDTVNNTVNKSIETSICTRLWDGLITNTSPMVTVFVENKSEFAQAHITYSAELNQGVCIYRYLLLDNDWRIEYDLETGHVSAIFE